MHKPRVIAAGARGVGRPLLTTWGAASTSRGPPALQLRANSDVSSGVAVTFLHGDRDVRLGLFRSCFAHPSERFDFVSNGGCMLKLH